MIRKELLTEQGWVPTGQYWEDDEPIATTLSPHTRLAHRKEGDQAWPAT